MPEITASRTLVKSPPELWAECSDAESLARHLGEFGEIRITRLEPETAVAWEGEECSGTVRFESSGWGTRVVITAQGGAHVPLPPPAVDPHPPQPARPRAPTSARSGLLGRLLGLLRPGLAAVPSHPEPIGSPRPADPELSAADLQAQDRLWGALDSLGAAHRRPFSRG